MLGSACTHLCECLIYFCGVWFCLTNLCQCPVYLFGFRLCLQAVQMSRLLFGCSVWSTPICANVSCTCLVSGSAFAHVCECLTYLFGVWLCLHSSVRMSRLLVWFPMMKNLIHANVSFMCLVSGDACTHLYKVSCTCLALGSAFAQLYGCLVCFLSIWFCLHSSVQRSRLLVRFSVWSAPVCANVSCTCWVLVPAYTHLDEGLVHFSGDWFCLRTAARMSRLRLCCLVLLARLRTNVSCTCSVFLLVYNKMCECLVYFGGFRF